MRSSARCSVSVIVSSGVLATASTSTRVRSRSASMRRRPRPRCGSGVGVDRVGVSVGGPVVVGTSADGGRRSARRRSDGVGGRRRVGDVDRSASAPVRRRSAANGTSSVGTASAIGGAGRRRRRPSRPTVGLLVAFGARRACGSRPTSRSMSAVSRISRIGSSIAALNSCWNPVPSSSARRRSCRTCASPRAASRGRARRAPGAG